MSTYVLIHGAGGSDSWYWHLVAPKLKAAGHDVVAPDLPIGDPSAGLEKFTDVVVDAIGDRKDLIVVGQSFAGFTAPIVCSRVKADLLVLLAAMIPRPGESASQWWGDTGYDKVSREQAERDGRPADGPPDLLSVFFHDVPPPVLSDSLAHGTRPEADTAFADPWPLSAWPDVPTRFLLCTQDRFFPASFLRPVVRDRLGVTPDEIDSGHLAALSHPDELTERLEQYRIQHQAGIR